ncbi:MAG: chitobiase/beta-hexosaminidase C-terminal domain-containing protein, partial [Gammaproteobacteria bacterium]|nr:chitobiase/beta-hexosaminidase C-terminal domain-containing protein [Gammaproteobacteria bacterium]
MLRSFTYFFFLLTALLLSACGGGSNEEAGKTSSPTLKLQGLASDGTALGNKKVILKGANGRLIRVTTSSEGVFTISNARLQPLGFPLLIQLATDDKTFLYSIATEDGYININPLTDLVIRNWFLSNGLDIDAEFPVSAPPPAPELNRVAKIQSLPGKQQLSSLRAVVSRLLERIYSSYRIKSEYDFFTKKFEIGPFEFNAILSYLKFDRKLDRLSMSYIEPTIGLEGKLLSDYDLTQALDSEDTQAPSIPTGLIARANQPSKVLLYWESSLDNKGVAGYRVFPDVVLIDFKDEIVSPPFLISGLTKNTEYCFTIKAIDSSNNLSEASSPVCVTTLQNEDGIGPANLSAPILVEKTDTRLALEWSASTEEDFLAYQLFLREGESPVRIKTLFNNGHVVENLRPSTRYCYQLKALDNSLNESGFTEQTCIVTHGEDTMAPETLISVPSRSYTQTKTIELLCVDEGYSGCSETYYTLDGSKPTTESLLYSQPLEISTDTTLRYFSVDNLGNTEEEKTANYSITIPNIPKRLTVVRNSATGVLSSNVGNINCGPVCEDSYSPNTLVTLTASNYSGLTPSWSGCFPSEDLSSCTITMKADSRVTINFLTTVNEATQNDTASPETQLIAAASLVSGHFDSQA